MGRKTKENKSASQTNIRADLPCVWSMVNTKRWLRATTTGGIAYLCWCVWSVFATVIGVILVYPTRSFEWPPK